MHITIQKFLQYCFIALIALPLPILILYYPFLSIQERVIRKRYYKKVKKHYDNPHAVSAEQLRTIFPNKRTEELNLIAYHLQEDNSYKDN